MHSLERDVHVPSAEHRKWGQIRSRILMIMLLSRFDDSRNLFN